MEPEPESPFLFFGEEMMNSLRDLEQQASAVAAEEIAVATNEGTFGAVECCRCTGCGDPIFGNYTIYEMVGRPRSQRIQGCDPADSPGYRRPLNRDVLVERRRLLSRLTTQICHLRD